MEYKIIRTEQSEEPIEHALFGKKGGAQKGSTWDNHKYIARQKMTNGWRYFYSQAELAAAKAKQTGQKAASAVGNAAKKGAANVKRSAADLKGYAGKVNSDRNRYKEALKKSSDMITSAHDRRTKAGDRVRGAEFGSTVSKKLADSLDAASKESMSKLKIFTAKKEKEAADSARKDANEYQRIRAEEFKKESNADKAEARAISNYLDIKNKAEAYEDNVNKVKYGLSTALNKADKAIDKGKSAASKLLSNAKSASSDAIDKGKKAVTSLLDYSKSAASDAVNKVKKVASDIDTDIYNAKVNAHNKKAAKEAVSYYESNLKKAAEKYQSAAEKYEVGSREWYSAKSSYEKAFDDYVDNARKAGSKNALTSASEIVGDMDYFGRKKK